MEDILPDFETCFKFIDRARDSNGICLIHCSDGVSRLGAIAIAYVMRQSGLSLKVCLNYSFNTYLPYLHRRQMTM